MNDLIRRKELYHDMAIKSLELHEKDLSWSEFIRGFNFAMEFVKNLPSVEPERKKGQWIIRYFDMETYKYKEKVYNYYEKMPEGDVYCSECKESALLNGHEESVFSNFCPYCGAEMRMRGEQ